MMRVPKQHRNWKSLKVKKKPYISECLMRHLYAIFACTNLTKKTPILIFINTILLISEIEIK